MSKRHHKVRTIAMLIAVVLGLAAIIWLVNTYVGDDSSTANGALIGAQVETGTPIKTPPTTVTLIVTGKADVTYNDGHSAVQTKGPFRITLPLRSGHNYSIASFNAKPIGSTCTIKIGTKTAITKAASGQGNTAGCVLTQERDAHTWMASTW